MIAFFNHSWIWPKQLAICKTDKQANGQAQGHWGIGPAIQPQRHRLKMGNACRYLRQLAAAVLEAGGLTDQQLLRRLIGGEDVISGLGIETTGAEIAITTDQTG